MQPAIRTRPAEPSRRAAIAIVLLALGVVFAALHRIADGGESHSYNRGALAPGSVHVTAGNLYEVSTPGGVAGLRQRGLSIQLKTCTYQGAGAAGTLSLAPLGAGTRTVHAVATFVSPVTGQVSIDCPGLPQGTFIDDADDAIPDPAGLFVLLATVAFTIGAALGLSALYRASVRRRQSVWSGGHVRAGGVDDVGLGLSAGRNALQQRVDQGGDCPADEGRDDEQPDV